MCPIKIGLKTTVIINEGNQSGEDLETLGSFTAKDKAVVKTKQNKTKPASYKYIKGYVDKIRWAT